MSSSLAPPATACAPGRRPSRLKIWLQAVRVFSFTASVVPILVASALAVNDRAFDPLLAAAMLLASVACHAGANLANDYHDHLKGIDAADAPGPSRVIQERLLSPAGVRRGMIVTFALATLLGLAIVAATGWPVLALALASLAAAYFYTGGPKPLGYVALGEVTVFLSIGVGMVLGASYVFIGTLTLAALLASLPIACLVAAILHANNIRDLATDRAAGKVTLATRLGRPAANREYALLLAGAYLATLALLVAEPRLWPALLPLLTLPTATALVRRLQTASSPQDLNSILRRTAGLHLRFGFLLTAGLFVAAVFGR